MDFKRRILVVDDEPIIRTLICDRFLSLGFDAWAAADAFSAQELARKHDPDALVVDLDLGEGPTGIELITAMAAKKPELGFVLLSNFSPAQWEMRVAQNLSFVHKSQVLDFQNLVNALNLVLSSRKRNSRLGASAELDSLPLTKKQTRVLALLADGLSNQEIAEKLEVSKGAIEQTVQRIYQALKLDEHGTGSRRVAAARIYAKTMGPSR